MTLIQYLVIQLLFFLFFIALSTIFGKLPEVYSYYLVNFMLFFAGSWLAALYLKRERPYTEVLSITLGFNLVTYLLLYAFQAVLPGWLEFIKDFLLVTIFSLAGAWFGRAK